MSVSLFLITIAAVFLIGIIGEVVFERTGIPDVVWLILVGIFLGPVTGLVAREQLAYVAPYFAAITLVIVLFDGGSGLNLKELVSAAPRATLLAVLGFLLSGSLVAVTTMGAAAVGLLPEEWTWLHGIITGAILGGSSSVVIMPALAKAKLEPRLANLVNLESALTDVLCVVVTIAAVRIAVSGSADASEAALALGKSFAIGLGVGATAGLLALLALRKLRRSEHAYPLILGTLLLLYVFIDHLGGSAPLGILAVAVLVGNAPTLSDAVGLAKRARLSRSVERAHDQITFIVKSFFFTFIGAMLGPPWALLALGVLLGLVLLGARIPAVYCATVAAKISRPERNLLVTAMPRGMAAGVLAVLPGQAGIPGMAQLPVVVFAGVFTTILLFAGGFPVFKRRLARALAATPSVPQDGGSASGEGPAVAAEPAPELAAPEPAPELAAPEPAGRAPAAAEVQGPDDGGAPDPVGAPEPGGDPGKQEPTI